MKKILTFISIFAMIFVISGCSTQTAKNFRGFVKENQFVIGVTTRTLAVEYVTRDARKTLATSRRVLETVGNIRNRIENKVISADEIYEIVESEIQYEKLSPAQASAVIEIMAMVQIKINELIAQKKLPAETILTTHQFLSWVEQAVKPYSK